MLNDARKLFTTALLAAALAMPGAVFGQQGGQMGGMNEPKQGQGKENHPEIHQAIEHLNQAKNILEHKAAHDFGGHRQQALDSINEALKHLHEAMNYDKK